MHSPASLAIHSTFAHCCSRAKVAQCELINNCWCLSQTGKQAKERRQIALCRQLGARATVLKAQLALYVDSRELKAASDPSIGRSRVPTRQHPTGHSGEQCSAVASPQSDSVSLNSPFFFLLRRC